MLTIVRATTLPVPVQFVKIKCKRIVIYKARIKMLNVELNA